MKFSTIFDVSIAGYQEWWLPFQGVVLGCVIVVLIFLSRGSDLKLVTRALKFALVFAAVWTLGFFFTSYSKYHNALAALSGGQYAVAEGPISDFQPVAGDLAPRGRKTSETFVVQSHRFFYPGFASLPGSTATEQVRDGIRDGVYARISYAGDLILKVEVAQ